MAAPTSLRRTLLGSYRSLVPSPTELKEPKINHPGFWELFTGFGFTSVCLQGVETKKKTVIPDQIKQESKFSHCLNEKRPEGRIRLNISLVFDGEGKLF